MYQKTVAALKVFAACALMLGLMTTMSSSTAAQTVCRNAPALGMVDSDGDGIATTGEIRALAPDNAELQSVAGQLEAQGITGVQYSGCSEGGDGSGTGGDTSGGSGDGSGTGGDTSGGGTGAEGDGSGTGGGAGADDSAGGEGASGTGGEGASGTGGGSESGTGGNATGGNASGGNATGGGDGTGAGATPVTSVPDTGTGPAADGNQAVLAVTFGAVALVAMLGALMLRSRRTS